MDNVKSSAPTNGYPQMQTTPQTPLDSILQKLASTSIAPATYNMIPSMGLPYAENKTTIPTVELTVEPLYGADEKFIYTMPASSRNDRIKLFNAQILDNRVKLFVNGKRITANEMHPADYQFVLFALKALLTPTISLEYKDAETNETYKIILDLRNDIPVTTLPELMEQEGFTADQYDAFLTFKLESRGIEFKTRYMTILETLPEENPIVKFAKMVESVDGHRLDITAIVHIFDNLLKSELDDFIEFVVKRSSFGLPSSIAKTVTLSDGRSITKDIPLSIDLFFPF